jgi:hypothetical protein
MASVRLTQLDGALPNLALMKLAHWHRAKGDNVTLTRQIERDLFEPAYDKAETWDRIWRRFNRMTERGISPYPMVYDKARKDLVAFQRWVVTGLYRIVPWNEYERETRSPESTAAFARLARVK